MSVIPAKCLSLDIIFGISVGAALRRLVHVHPVVVLLTPQAANAYASALRSRPDYPPAHYNLAGLREAQVNTPFLPRTVFAFLRNPM